MSHTKTFNYLVAQDWQFNQIPFKVLSVPLSLKAKNFILLMYLLETSLQKKRDTEIESLFLSV